MCSKLKLTARMEKVIMDFDSLVDILKDIAVVFLAAILYAPVGIGAACLAAWLATH